MEDVIFSLVVFGTMLFSVAVLVMFFILIVLWKEVNDLGRAVSVLLAKSLRDE